MITQQQVRISTTAIAATLALGTALTIGGMAGYAVRGLAQPQSAVTSESRHIVNPGIGQHRLDALDAPDADELQPAPQDGNRADSTTSESNHVVKPGICLHRLDALDAEDLGTASQTGNPILGNQTYCAAPWGPCLEP